MLLAGVTSLVEPDVLGSAGARLFVSTSPVAALFAARCSARPAENVVGQECGFCWLGGVDHLSYDVLR